MHLLLTILLFIFLLAAPVILLVLRVAGNLFRVGRPRTSTDSTRQKSRWTSTFSRQQSQKKVFDKSEGEYVDFEEIKE